MKRNLWPQSRYYCPSIPQNQARFKFIKLITALALLVIIAFNLSEQLVMHDIYESQL